MNLDFNKRDKFGLSPGERALQNFAYDAFKFILRYYPETINKEKVFLSEGKSFVKIYKDINREKIITNLLNKFGSFYRIAITIFCEFVLFVMLRIVCKTTLGTNEDISILGIFLLVNLIYQMIATVFFINWTSHGFEEQENKDNSVSSMMQSTKKVLVENEDFDWSSIKVAKVSERVNQLLNKTATVIDVDRNLSIVEQVYIMYELNEHKLLQTVDYERVNWSQLSVLPKHAVVNKHTGQVMRFYWSYS